MDGLFSLLSVLQILLLMVLYTLSIVFENLFITGKISYYLQIMSLCYYFIEIVLNFLTVRRKMGKRIEIIK